MHIVEPKDFMVNFDSHPLIKLELYPMPMSRLQFLRVKH